MNLDFLKDVKLEVVKKTASKARTTVVKLPVEADLRVFSNGKVFPSESFATKYELEYQPKANIAEEGKEPNLVVVGNGLDVFSSKDWGMIAGKLPQDLLFCCAVPKSSAKVDMWASTKYDENDVPKASVFTQGAATFGKKQLLPMISDTYGVDWETVDYVDMTVSIDNVITSENGIYHLPKIVSGGAHQGEQTYIRRENLTICPLVVVHTENKVIPEQAEKPSLDKALEPTEEAGEDWAAKLGQKEDAN